jgi:UDP-N-acetylglucosamine:LPS N-acetylglucosamine transferase
LNAIELSKAIQESEFILCRSGYSTLMDLLMLNKKMMLVPTPGQTEQEYLANYLMQSNLAISVNQNVFNLKAILEKVNKFQFVQREVKVFNEQKLFNILNSLK